MLYDMTEQRWKIERLIQKQPLGSHARKGAKARVLVTAELPVAAGRDS